MYALATLLLAALARADVTICDLQDLVDKQAVGRTGVQIIGGRGVEPDFELSSCGSSIDSMVQPIWSASKVVTGTIALMVHEDETVDFSLDDPVHKHLQGIGPYGVGWPVDENDKRSHITIRHLLVQNSGLMGCECCFDSAMTYTQCAYYIQKNTFVEEQFELHNYDEGNFVTIIAAALQATKMDSYNDLWAKYIAGPVGIDISQCTWNFPMTQFAEPGAGLSCTGRQFAKFLGALVNEKLISAENFEFMSSHNVDVQYDFGWAEGYGFGTWTKKTCNGEPCFTDGHHYVHSIGYEGTMPMWRFGKDKYWMIIMRSGGMLGTQWGCQDVWSNTKCEDGRWIQCFTDEVCKADNTFDLEKYPLCGNAANCRDCLWHLSDGKLPCTTDPATVPEYEELYMSYGMQSTFKPILEENWLKNFEDFLFGENPGIGGPKQCNRCTEACGHKDVSLKVATVGKENMKTDNGPCGCTVLCAKFDHWTFRPKGKSDMQGTCTCMKAKEGAKPKTKKRQGFVSSVPLDQD